MARSLPFEVAPTQQYHQIGDEERGILKFRRRRSISIPERLSALEVDESEAIFKAVADLSVLIHREPKFATHELHEVYLAAVGAMDAMAISGTPTFQPLEAEIALAYTAELQALNRRREANNEAVIIRQATVMIQHRLTGCRDWTDDDTKALDSEQLIAAIAMFYRDEASGGSVSAATTAVRQLEELKAELGKLQQDPGSQPPNPTGDASTGDAEAPTQETQTSLPSDSDPSPSPTSSTPSTTRRSGNGKGSTTKS